MAKPAQFSLRDMFIWVALCAFGVASFRWFPLNGAILTNQLLSLTIAIAVFRTRPIIRTLHLGLCFMLFTAFFYGPILLQPGREATAFFGSVCVLIYLASMAMEVWRMVLGKDGERRSE